jgi:hypothetical protein
MKEHPRARAYLDSLQTSLSAIWQELDVSGVIAYQQSFAKMNKGRESAMFEKGDYVMHYQPCTQTDNAPGKLLLPRCGPWRTEQRLRSRDFEMRHIESGVVRTVAGNTLTAAPPPDAPGDYSTAARCPRGLQHLRYIPDRLAGPYGLTAGEFMTVRTGQFYSVARTKEVYSDGSAHVEWFNTKDGTGNASSKYLKVYADSKADAGEVYQMKGDPTKRLWALVDRKDMVCTSPWKAMASEQRAVMIPPSVRKYFAAGAGSRKAANSTNGGKKK